MFRRRLLSGGVIVCLFVTLTVLDFQRVGGAPPGAWLLLWLLMMMGLATEEVLSLLAAKNLRPVQWPVYFGTLLVTLAFALPILSSLWSSIASSDSLQQLTQDDEISSPVVALAVAVTLVLAVEMRRFEKPGQHVIHIALAVFTIVYIGVLGGFMVALRLFQDHATGMTALLSMLFVVKLSDVGAYLFGRVLGANKLTPKLSPGKTVEGAIGGVATACVASWLFFRFIAPQLDPTIVQGLGYQSWFSAMGYGLVLSIAAMIGDLAESLLKRDMERKDSSTRLPGLGGVLDVIDSLLVGAPAAWLCWKLGLV